MHTVFHSRCMHLCAKKLELDILSDTILFKVKRLMVHAGDLFQIKHQSLIMEDLLRLRDIEQ